MVESSIDDNELGTLVVARVIVLHRVIRDERRQNRVWRARVNALVPCYEKETEYKKKRNRVEKGREEATKCSISFSFII